MKVARLTLSSLCIAAALITNSCDSPAPSENRSSARLSVSPNVATARVDALGEHQYTKDFRLQDCTLETTGNNPYFPLVPGRTYIYEGVDNGQTLRLEQTILDSTLVVDGVDTRILEEHHFADGALVEISRNYFAHCVQTNSVFYFGEDTDNYSDGRIINHDGSWRAGVNGAHAGLVMPGVVLLGSRFFQEIAPPVALDRAEVTRMGLATTVPYGAFRDVIETAETTPLEPGVVEFKLYAPGIGQIVDDVLRLIAVSGT